MKGTKRKTTQKNSKSIVMRSWYNRDYQNPFKCSLVLKHVQGKAQFTHKGTDTELK